ncbi:Similar to Brf1: Transcription factor IIIB 90 kDa subunit (Mus musculus) [Cotesia congregata]|uniref:B-related factor 1 n=1 Tax=Cotesia congregata TaxID=51543 RepID=A0A8J2EKZ2_COTCN|nr:Similar to Brf1: Transcription factor IIIB 90 kDa subunit (Mus musculus) [Cotesia congregata]
MPPKCPKCGCTELDTDPSRGDTVCTNCGLVTEDQMLVNEVEFTQTASGQSEAVGQFLGTDMRAPRVGQLHGQSSRELTVYRARKDIAHLCKQLSMSGHQVELATNFYKQVLHRNLTRGRKQILTYAGCIYLTCRIEKTPHLLIDISDITQIDVYELGRTYLHFVKALYLENSVDGAISIDSEDGGNECIKAVDPCLYVMRFAEKLEFGTEKMKVAKTALRLVARMKKDNIHTGRRPSGICGAALLIAARMHDFNRTVGDIIKVVKIHESTLRKRLLEFGETSASALTLDDFESIDFAQEEDPPAFKAARKAEENLREADFMDIGGEFTDLQKEIDKADWFYLIKIKLYLSEQQQRSKKRSLAAMLGADYEEDAEVDRFIESTTREIAENFVEDRGLGPDVSSMGLPNNFFDRRVVKEGSRFEKYNNESGEIDLEGLDDEELDEYILKDADVVKKTELWTVCNADYLELQRKKEEQRLKDEEEGKPPPRKRKAPKKKELANSAGEALENLIKEKKLSKKLNYDVIKQLKEETSIGFGEKKSIGNNYDSAGFVCKCSRLRANEFVVIKLVESERIKC